MSEIERAAIEKAIKGFEHEIRCIKASEARSWNTETRQRKVERETLAVSLLRAELARQDATPLTWNERINQMTVEEKARDLLFANAQDHVFKGTPLEGKFCYIALDGGYYGSSDEAIAASEKFLNSPYTEGATK